MDQFLIGVLIVLGLSFFLFLIWVFLDYKSYNKLARHLEDIINAILNSFP